MQGTYCTMFGTESWLYSWELSESPSSCVGEMGQKLITLEKQVENKVPTWDQREEFSCEVVRTHKLQKSFEYRSNLIKFYLRKKWFEATLKID